MGEVILVLKVFPAGPDKVESVKQALEQLGPKRLEEEPIAFGMKVLIFTAMIPDEGGHQDILEEKIRAIDGVQDLEVLKASRSM